MLTGETNVKMEQDCCFFFFFNNSCSPLTMTSDSRLAFILTASLCEHNTLLIWAPICYWALLYESVWSNHWLWKQTGFDFTILCLMRKRKGRFLLDTKHLSDGAIKICRTTVPRSGLGLFRTATSCGCSSLRELVLHATMSSYTARKRSQLDISRNVWTAAHNLALTYKQWTLFTEPG